MIRYTTIIVVLLASPASAHCFSIWHYPHPQPGCFVHAHVAHNRAAWAAGGRYGRSLVGRILFGDYGGKHRVDAHISSRYHPDSSVTRTDPPGWAVDELRIKLRRKLSGEIR